MSTYSRRSFLKSTGFLGGGLTACGLGIVPESAWAGVASFGLPYYKKGAPFLQNLQNGSGEVLHLHGVVYAQDGKTPLANATVEIWHCNEAGQFDFSNQYQYRGKTFTDNKGRYRFKTNFPGKYKERGQLKMKRIFVLVTSDGYRESFSQLYFDAQKNPYIDHLHWAVCPMAERPSLPKKLDCNKQTIVLYHHYLKRYELFHLPQAKELADSRLRIYPGHHQHSFLTFGKSQPGNVIVRLLDKGNRVIGKHVFKDVQPGQALAIDNSQLKAGVYNFSIYTSRFGDFTRVLRLG